MCPHWVRQFHYENSNFWNYLKSVDKGFGQNIHSICNARPPQRLNGWVFYSFWIKPGYPLNSIFTNILHYFLLKAERIKKILWKYVKGGRGVKAKMAMSKDSQICVLVGFPFWSLPQQVYGHILEACRERQTKLTFSLLLQSLLISSPLD